jgi:hypothetical protein
MAKLCATFAAHGRHSPKRRESPGYWCTIYGAPRSEIWCLGVPQKTAREISGHKTDAVFSRYNIVSGADIADAARKIEEGARAALKGSIHSSFIVEPQPSQHRKRKQ